MFGTFESLPEKTGLQGFRPGRIQAGLYSHRRWLETWNGGVKNKRNCTICAAKTKALISCAVTEQLICFFDFAYAIIHFSRDAAHFFHSD